MHAFLVVSFCGMGERSRCVAVLLVHSKLRIWNEIKGRHKRTNCTNATAYFYVRLLSVLCSKVAMLLARFTRIHMYMYSRIRVLYVRIENEKKKLNLGCTLSFLLRAYRVHVCVYLVILFSERWTFARPLNGSLCLMATNQPSSGLSFSLGLLAWCPCSYSVCWLFRCHFFFVSSRLFFGIGETAQKAKMKRICCIALTLMNFYTVGLSFMAL